MKVKELRGVLKESIYILNLYEEKELFIPTKTGEIYVNEHDEILWEKYGEYTVEEIFNEYESMIIKIK
ncbi:hypothetical protein [Clostridium hydrogeniformans]|uniref:hypothetical protein n=1 Tax=Clostridium hydrogeniformans TaxID=349933 RepID=UPI00047FA176|nr:hypothetical protein [Clostridium hydrogeniformans]